MKTNTASATVTASVLWGCVISHEEALRVIDAMGLAFGGHSQYTWRDVARACLGHCVNSTAPNASQRALALFDAWVDFNAAQWQNDNAIGRHRRDARKWLVTQIAKVEYSVNLGRHSFAAAGW